MTEAQNTTTQIQEHDACGKGIVIGTSARKYGLDVLESNGHRIGRNPVFDKSGNNVGEVGDGAGVCTEIPFNLIEKDLKLPAGTLSGKTHGIATMYFPGEPEKYEASKAIMNEILAKYGLEFEVERKLPLNLDAIHESIRDRHKNIEQIVFKRPTDLEEELEKQLGKDGVEKLPEEQKEELKERIFKKRMLACQLEMEQELLKNGLTDCVVGALDNQKTVYKGILFADQVRQLFKDMQNEEFNPNFFEYHGRQSTNSATSLKNVHPFLKGEFSLDHNGEIVTIAGNRSQLISYIRDNIDPEFEFPFGISDSHTLSYALAYISSNEGISAPEVIKKLFAAGWRMDPRKSEAEQAMFKMANIGMAPYAGPACVTFSDSTTIYTIMDFGGLRPFFEMTLKDGTVICGSESALPKGVSQDDVVSIRTLGNLKMCAYDLKTGKRLSDKEITESLLASKDYIEELAKKLRIAEKVTKEKFSEALEKAKAESARLLQRQIAFGHDKQSVDRFSVTMGTEGKTPVGAMGNDTPPYWLTLIPSELFRAMKQEFSIVTAPPHDAKREGYVMDVTTYLGASKVKDSPVIEIDSCILKFGQLEVLEKQISSTAGMKNHRVDCTFDIASGLDGYRARLNQIIKDVEEAVRNGATNITLSDMAISDSKAPLDSSLIAAMVHKHLKNVGLRGSTSIIFESGSVKTEHDAAMLITNGIDAVYPAMHYANVIAEHPKNKEFLITGSKTERIKIEDALMLAHKGMEAGVINTMSKSGIPSVSAYRESQKFSFEGLDVGPNEPELHLAFGNIFSPLPVYGLQKIYENGIELHKISLTAKTLPDFKEYFAAGKQSGEAESHPMKYWATVASNEMRKKLDVLENPPSEEELRRLKTIKELLDLLEKPPSELEIREMKTAIDSPFGSIPEVEIQRMQAIINFFDNPPSSTELKRMKEEGSTRNITNYEQRLKTWNTISDKEKEEYRIWSESIEGSKVILDGGSEIKKKALRKLSVSEINDFKLGERHRAAFTGMDDYTLRKLKDDKGNEIGGPSGLMGMIFPKTVELTDKEFEDRLKDVQDAYSIMGRMTIPAMSIGALTANANQTLSLVANSLNPNGNGLKKNTGEGGSIPENQIAGTRKNDDAQDVIVQLGSSRFGVDIEFVISPDRWVENEKGELSFVPGKIQIKMAQGAKPGEGGQLPGEKVTELIAALRNAFPGVDLPSPAPHHDIYSIEDLYQLVRDCKRTAIKGLERPVDVKIASAGADVLPVALGVAKMGVDSITVAFGGGTGAGPDESRHRSSRLMEDAISISRALDKAGFKDNPRRIYEGHIKTPIDMIRAVMAGFDDVGIGTGSLIAEGCKWLQKCNVAGACTPGIANAEEKFQADPTMIQEYFLAFSHGVREILAKMEVDGKPVTSLDQIRGRTDLIELYFPEEFKGKKEAIEEHLKLPEGGVTPPDRTKKREVNEAERDNYWKEDLIVQTLLTNIIANERNAKTGLKPYQQTLVVEDPTTNFQPVQAVQFVGPRIGAVVASMNAILKEYPGASIEEVAQSIRDGTKIPPEKKTGNVVALKEKKIPNITIKIAGPQSQSFGCYTPEGVNYEFVGAAGYGAFKMTSGGEHTLRTPVQGELYHKNVVVQNSFAFGARGGFFSVEGSAGPRALVRASGCAAVIDGDLGDNSCNFVTDASVVVLGDTGINFGSGASALFAAVYGRKEDLDKKCHSDVVVFKASERSPEYLDVVKMMLEKHLQMQQASKGISPEQDKTRPAEILKNWEIEKENFCIVLPKALAKQLEAEQVDSIISSHAKRRTSREPDYLKEVWLREQQAGNKGGKFSLPVRG